MFIQPLPDVIPNEKQFRDEVKSRYGRFQTSSTSREIYDQWEAFQTMRDPEERNTWIATNYAKTSQRFTNVRLYLQMAMVICPTPAIMWRKWNDNDQDGMIGVHFKLNQIATTAWGGGWCMRPGSKKIYKMWQDWCDSAQLYPCRRLIGSPLACYKHSTR